MAKRKAGVNNIIYELDNEDLTASSDDEGKESKIICTEHNNFSEDIKNSLNTSDIVIEITDVKLSDDTNYENLNNDVLNNGGKIDADIVTKEIDSKKITNECESKVNGSLDDRNKSTEICKTIIFNEDIDIDSPASNSDLGVVGCENRTPLVSVRFKDNKLAKNYKKKVKEFMLNLIKLHETDLFTADSDTDVEFDIWPEDLSEEELEEPPLPPPEVDNLFFVDTDPKNVNIDIPMYEQASILISNTTEGETSSPQVLRRGPTCFNCDGAHPLRECTLPRNNARIAENRRNIGVKLGRYHVEDDQKYGHLIPGRISGQLRHALGLKRNEIPMHIYKMRMLGYPPGWLEEARISHSGITMFDSTGRAIMDPEEEEGEVSEPGCKDKFDIKKILDFPGFNVPASSRYKEESHLYGFPPMSEQDSKMVMLQMLAPNAMKAYKRKKLTFFPSSNNNSLQEGQAEMELDSGDENPAFPSVPPLPDDEPPPVPPPPSSPPPESPKPKLITNIQNEDKENESDKSQSDIEVIEVIQVTDIPVPEDELITIDDDDEVSMVSSGRNSPTIDDLEAKKRQLLDAIKFTETATDSGTDTDLKEVDILEDISEIESTEAITSPIPKVTDTIEELNNDDIKNVNDTDISSEDVKPSTSPPPVIENVPPSDSEVTKTPDMKTGIVKNTQYGTPVINTLSPYVKVPTDDKFAKDICDVIQFENLPNSIGKYKKISSLLKKVKGEVERIQDS